MTKTTVCPTCNSVNKPKAVVCRVCGTRITRGPAKVATGEPVVLERVMTGEVFTAVAGRVAEARESEENRRAREEKPSAPEERFGSTKAIQIKEAKTGADPTTAKIDETNAPPEPPWLEGPPGPPPNPLVAKGDALLRAGRHFEGAAAFEEALRENPDDETAWLGMCRALSAAKDTRGALASVDNAIKIRPGYGQAWLERGLLTEAMRDFREALRSFKCALELLPGNAVARTHVAALQAKAAAVAQAAADLTSAETDNEHRPEPPSGETASAAGRDHAFEVPTTSPKAPAENSRVRTFVEGLDEALGGGIPQGSVVVVEGVPGTMKSSLAGSLLLRNAIEAGRRGLYITFEESAASLTSQLRSLGLNPLDAGDRVRFFDMRGMADAIASSDAEWIEALKRVLSEAHEGGTLDLVVLDSLEALEILAKFKDRRRQIFRLFEWLRDLGLTAFIIAERPDVVVGHVVVQGRWDEDFLADGVIQLRLHRVSDVDVQRRLRVLKMRGTRHETAYFAFLVDEGRFRVTRAMGT